MEEIEKKWLIKKMRLKSSLSKSFSLTYSDAMAKHYGEVSLKERKILNSNPEAEILMSKAKGKFSITPS
jgi:hypothetical protein